MFRSASRRVTSVVGGWRWVQRRRMRRHDRDRVNGLEKQIAAFKARYDAASAAASTEEEHEAAWYAVNDDTRDLYHQIDWIKTQELTRRAFAEHLDVPETWQRDGQPLVLNEYRRERLRRMLDDKQAVLIERRLRIVAALASIVAALIAIAKVAGL